MMPAVLQPNAAIPINLRRKPVGDEDIASAKSHAAGTLYVAPDGAVLLLRRSPNDANFAGHWSLPGGGVEDGESPEDGARREAMEEMGPDIPQGKRKLIDQKVTPTGMMFHTFAQPVDEKFTPKLNSEHTGFDWSALNALPSPMHPAVQGTLNTRLGLASDMSPEDWQGMVGGLLKFLAEEAQEPEHQAADEKPRTLYVRRPLKNAADVIAWAKKAGFSKTLMPDDMHVTLAHSKTPMDWSRIVPDETMTAADDGGARSVEKLGDKGAVVLRFTADNLSKRWADLKDAGAVWDFPSYKPHVTLTYEGGDIDLSKIVPFSEPLEFGPEIFEEVDEGWANKVQHAEDADFKYAALALDRESIKSKDVDGRLHVADVPLCRESVDPYKGSEIPGYRALGLDPEKIYRLWRPADELEKAIGTINGIPVLRKHVATSAVDHKSKDTIGSTGTGARWDPPFIRGELVIWPASDIEGIENKEKYNLSPGYRYQPVMEIGDFAGEHYDGKMTKLAFNHIAVVEAGRQAEVAIDHAMVDDDSFNEGDHPRAPDGKFGSGGKSPPGTTTKTIGPHGGNLYRVTQGGDPRPGILSEAEKHALNRPRPMPLSGARASEVKPQAPSSQANKKEISSEALTEKLKGMSEEKLHAALANKDVDPMIKAHIKKHLTSRLLGHDEVPWTALERAILAL